MSDFIAWTVGIALTGAGLLMVALIGIMLVLSPILTLIALAIASPLIWWYCKWMRKWIDIFFRSMP